MIPRPLLLVPAVLFALATPVFVAALPAQTVAPPSEPPGRDVPEALATSAWPRFALFGWVSPPLALTSQSRYAEMANAGFDVTVLALDDSGCVRDNLARLNAARPVGVRSLLLDNRLDSVFVARPATLALADTIVSAYVNDPAFLGYYLGDEPDSANFGRLGEWFEILRQRDPAHPSWNNLRGIAGFGSQAGFEAYVREYVAATRPALLCNTHYEFLTTGDQHLLTKNVSTMAKVARETGIPFWGVIQIVQYGPFRRVTDGMIRWEAAQWLAWGARGIGYMTYWTPVPDAEYNWQPAMIAWDTSQRTALYDTVRTINAKLEPIGSTLAGARWLGTEYAGSVPPGGTPFTPSSILSAVSGRATLGLFADSTGTPLVLLANADSLGRQSLTLVPAPDRTVWRLQDDGSGWVRLSPGAQGRVTLTFNPGDFALLRFVGPIDAFVAGVDGHGAGTLQLGLSPNPGRGAVRFSFAGVGHGGRLDLLDVSGRRVWSAVCAAGANEVSWSGEDDRGGRAPAGIYLARLSGAGGTTFRRLAWLGDR